MATFQKRQGAWRAIVRKKGHPSQSKTFSTKARAQKWARQVEGLTANLISINRRYKAHASLRVTDVG